MTTKTLPTSPESRLKDLQISLVETNRALSGARESLGTLVAREGSAHSAEAQELLGDIARLEASAAAVRMAIPTVEREIEAERAGANAQADAKRIALQREAALRLEKAAREFDAAAEKLEAAFDRVCAAADGLTAVGAGSRAMHLPGRVATALHATAPGVVAAVAQRARHGLPISAGRAPRLAESFAVGKE